MTGGDTSAWRIPGSVNDLTAAMENGKSYDAVGNFPAEHFDKQWPHLQDRIRDHLGKADYVPVDVSQFTPLRWCASTSGSFGDRVFVVGG